MTKGFDVKLDVCAYQLRTFDGEISCRLGQRSQPGLTPGREASRVQLLRQAEPAGFNSRQGASRVRFQAGGHEIGPGSIRARELCLERLVLQLAYASGDQSRLDILMRFFTVMCRTYLV